MTRILRFSFGLAAYFFFFASFLYLIGFVHNVFVPRSIDVGPATPTLEAAAVDILLLALFGFQHSIMARPGFKAALTRFWPPAVERSLYVAATAAVLVLLFLLWRPLPELLWAIEAEWARVLILTVAALGWVAVLISTFLISHFQLFGLHQIWADLRQKTMPDMAFKKPLFYKLVRHPIYTGFLLAFWFTPDMSQGHLLFAVGMTIYILIGIRYEERDLKKNLGAVYVEYTREVGMLVPGLGRSRDR